MGRSASTSAWRMPPTFGMRDCSPTHTPSYTTPPKCSTKWPYSSGAIVPIGSLTSTSIRESASRERRAPASASPPATVAVTKSRLLSALTAGLLSWSRNSAGWSTARWPPRGRTSAGWLGHGARSTVAASSPARRRCTARGVRAPGRVWAGGQQAVPGRVTAQLRKRDDFIEWDVTAEMDQPIKAVTSVIRGLPRGQISAAGNEPFDPRDNELLFGYPFSGGDLFGANTAWGLSTPLVIVQRAEGDCVFVSSLDDRVRAKRFFLQPGEPAYRLEAVLEAEGWKDQTTLREIGRAHV